MSEEKYRPSLDYRMRRMMLPGLKRWILVVGLALVGIIYGVLLLIGVHPLYQVGSFFRDIVFDAAHFLPRRWNGILAIVASATVFIYGLIEGTKMILGAYLPDDREALPDVLYRKRHLDKGPKVVVIGGGTGLSNLLRGLKRFTNNITAIVTVADDGGSSGRLRQELGVLPPGDIRNCITALADEDKLVTELFHYRFEHGQGLEGHNFGNLFITALVAITKGDMIQAVRTASRVLNSCGQVLPSTLDNITLVAEMQDGTEVRGESHISHSDVRIRRVLTDPPNPKATVEAVEAILDAELIILGPGSLYTSIVPNLLVPGIAAAVRQSGAAKLYVCNILTQPGETTNYTVGDHVEALMLNSGTPAGQGNLLMNTVLVSDLSKTPAERWSGLADGATPVRFDAEKVKSLAVGAISKSIVSDAAVSHHDPVQLARTIMMWFFRVRAKRKTVKKKSDRLMGGRPVGNANAELSSGNSTRAKAIVQNPQMPKPNTEPSDDKEYVSSL
ncbi:MAG: uridine diphosphate-N-acetylglucosamine-binding protein YvcK [Cyanobacteria bacterium REEB67]|nr:uridine diphosphate-N-acetylglucosamine-binding protein YvcK [Cyanobacteria bacterium REEB67]